MPRKPGNLAPAWRDCTSLGQGILVDAARFSACDPQQFTRPGFPVHFHDYRGGLGTVTVEKHCMGNVNWRERVD